MKREQIDPKHLCRDQRGFTLIELMLAIAVIAALLGAIMLGVSAINSGNLSTAEQSIMTLYQAGMAWASQQANPGFNGVTMTLLKSSGALPNSASETNPWGNPYVVSGTATTFTVTTDAATAANCTALLQRFTPRASNVGCNINAIPSKLLVTF